MSALVFTNVRCSLFVAFKKMAETSAKNVRLAKKHLCFCLHLRANEWRIFREKQKSIYYLICHLSGKIVIISVNIRNTRKYLGQKFFSTLRRYLKSKELSLQYIYIYIYIYISPSIPYNFHLKHWKRSNLNTSKYVYLELRKVNGEPRQIKRESELNCDQFVRM